MKQNKKTGEIVKLIQQAWFEWRFPGLKEHGKESVRDIMNGNILTNYVKQKKG